MTSPIDDPDYWRDRAAEATYAEAVEDFAAKFVRVRYRRPKQIEALLNDAAAKAWHAKPIASIRRVDVLTVLDAIMAARPLKANKWLAAERRCGRKATTRAPMFGCGSSWRSARWASRRPRRGTNFRQFTLHLPFDEHISHETTPHPSWS